MDFQQSGIVLDKINSLYKSLQAGGGQIAPIERDLMLSYIRQLYDAVLNPAASAPVVSPAPKPEDPPVVVAPQRKPVPPRIIEIPDTLKDMAAPPPVKQTPPPPKVETPAPEPQKQPEPIPQSTRQPEPAQGKVSAKVEALFSISQARELSDKLSERPVTDLTKAMAINDRLQYVNELFGKDADAMNETLKLLNKLESFDQARSLLLSVAEQYRWADEETVDVAKTFIKLIRRRYH